MKKKIVAMLLAGGQGSRLGVLTSNMAKPAVPFGGKYRIIDFPLSNCVNSGIDTVGVLTQYRPLALNAYLGTGQYWDLDRNHGGVFVLPPYMTEKVGQWYSGTANAIWQNREFVDQYDPEYVLILSGDHIYKMNYADMLAYHEKMHAAATIAVINVPLEEAHRFGIMNTDGEGRIVSFEEKPAQPKSTNASMGIYIFNWKLLKSYMARDDADPQSANDFGKNIIPAMLDAGEIMAAYPFQGYWKDVGTVQSLWEANMDLLQTPPAFNLYDDVWRIYARNPIQPPHFMADTAVVDNAMITEGCDVAGAVRHSILFAGVHIEEGATIVDSVIMPGAVIKSGAVVTRAIVGEDSVINAGCVVGRPEAPGEDNRIALVGQHTVLPENFVVNPGDQIDSDVLRLERSVDV